MRISASLALSAGKQRRIADAFRGVNALTGANAKRLRELGLNDSEALRGMVASTIIRKAGPDRYFLDEAVWAARRGLSGNTVLRIAIVVGLVAGAVVLFNAVS